MGHAPCAGLGKQWELACRKVCVQGCMSLHVCVLGGGGIYMEFLLLYMEQDEASKTQIRGTLNSTAPLLESSLNVSLSFQQKPTSNSAIAGLTQAPKIAP